MQPKQYRFILFPNANKSTGDWLEYSINGILSSVRTFGRNGIEFAIEFKS